MNRILCLNRFYREVRLDWQFRVFYPLSSPWIADISSWLRSFEFFDWVWAALIAKHLAICVNSRFKHPHSRNRDNSRWKVATKWRFSDGVLNSIYVMSRSYGVCMRKVWHILAELTRSCFANLFYKELLGEDTENWWLSRLSEYGCKRKVFPI